MSITTLITQFRELLRTQVDKGIYVWGGNGHLLTGMSDPRGWIRKHETSTANANRAVALYDRRVQSGITEIRAFDCSGLIYWALNKLGLQASDINSRGLYARCKPVIKADLRVGDLTFRHNGERIYHVGAYVGGGRVIECIGRDDGVIEHGIDAMSTGYWTHYGRLDMLGGIDMATIIQHTSPMMQGNNIKALQAALNGLGYDCGTADGKAGAKTMAGIAAFAAAHGGLVGAPALPDTATLTITVGDQTYSVEMG